MALRDLIVPAAPVQVSRVWVVSDGWSTVGSCSNAVAKSNGDTSNELPVPATFVVEPSGRIVFAHHDPNWGVRLEPAAIISALEKPRNLGVIRA